METPRKTRREGTADHGDDGSTPRGNDLRNSEWSASRRVIQHGNRSDGIKIKLGVNLCCIGNIRSTNIGGVGDQLTQENLLVWVEGVDDEGHQLIDLSLWVKKGRKKTNTWARAVQKQEDQNDPRTWKA
jgi:hypothetical protein